MMDTTDFVLWLLGVILVVAVTAFLILIGTKIENNRLTQELCNKQQYDFCEQIVEYKIKN